MVEASMFMSKVAEQGERYDDMFDYLKQFVTKKAHFTPDERNLMSVAFKNLVTPKRTTWRTITAVEQSQQPGKTTQKAIDSYKAVIEERLHKNCEDVVELMRNVVIPKVEKFLEREKSSQAFEERAFFYKMIGDYYRYGSEAISSKASHEKLPKFKKGALEAYKRAMELCVKGIKPYNTVRLGLALNFSVFYYEVMSDARKACEIAKGALEDALEVIDECSEEMF